MDILLVEVVKLVRHLSMEKPKHTSLSIPGFKPGTSDISGDLATKLLRSARTASLFRNLPLPRKIGADLI